MQMMMKRLLAVMDGEGRKLQAVFFEGEQIRLIDRRGKWREGMLKRVTGDSVTIKEADGHLRCLLFNDIDHLERDRRDTDADLTHQ